MPNDLKIRIHSDDPRLKRHIVHDIRSAQYQLATAGLDVVDCDWTLVIARLNQLAVGKCTAESATEVLGSDPIYPTLPAGIGAELNDAWSTQFYSDEETLDGNGTYPPTDGGSSGLTSAKVAKNRGLISGYLHTFTAEDAIKAIQTTPACWGTLWKSGMDAVNTTTGQVKYTGTTRGGHELSIFKIDAKLEQVWFHNHWGPWGYQNSGDAWISFDDFAKSLADQGDVTFYTPLGQPAPSPTPAPNPVPVDAFATFAAEAGPWAAQRHTGGNGVMATATKTYLLAAAAVNSDADVRAHAARHGHVYLDAGTGHFVSAAYATANPDTTVRIEH